MHLSAVVCGACHANGEGCAMEAVRAVRVHFAHQTLTTYTEHVRWLIADVRAERTPYLNIQSARSSSALLVPLRGSGLGPDHELRQLHLASRHLVPPFYSLRWSLHPNALSIASRATRGRATPAVHDPRIPPAKARRTCIPPRIQIGWRSTVDAARACRGVRGGMGRSSSPPAGSGPCGSRPTASETRSHPCYTPAIDG